MAKKEKNKNIDENIDELENSIADESENDQKKDKIKKEKIKKIKVKKEKSKLIPIFITFSILAGIGAMIYFNTFGIRNQYIIPLIQKVPIVKNIIPLREEELSATNNLSKDELIAKNNELEKEIAKLTEEKDVLNKKNELYSTELLRLQDIEYQQLEYKKDKEAFDTLVASGDQKAFMQFYEKLSPENADKLYKEAVVLTQQTKEKKNFISTFSAMDEGSASKILQEMIGTDMDLVVDVLKNVGTDTSAAILAAMDTKNAATIAKRMSPKTQQ